MEYRGLTIQEYIDKRSGVTKFKVRFQLKGKEYAPWKYSSDELKKEINRIFTLVDEGKNPATEEPLPFVKEVLARELEAKTPGKKHTLYERVYKDFLSVIPALRINELTQSDYNAYIELRQKKISRSTGVVIKNATINKELSAINVALENSPKYFRSLHNYKPLLIKKLADDYEHRTRTLSEKESEKLLNYLYADKKPGERNKDYLYRVRLGHWIEFESLTGLRRGELVLLKPENFDKNHPALIDFLRPKTNTIVEFFPIVKRAAEILEERLKAGTPFLFSDDGRPTHSHYRKLKKVCNELNIKYGSFIKGGFVLHDLRRNFATDIVRSTDIETAREFLGHADLTHTGIYLSTDRQRMIDAVRKLDGYDLEKEITEIIFNVADGNLAPNLAIKKLLKIIKNR